MGESISFLNLNMFLSLLLFGLSIALPIFVVIFESQPLKKRDVPGLLLPYALFFNVGCLFFLGFMAQLFYGPQVAREINWSWSPFQYELAFSELALAVQGLISPLFRKEFWLATIIGSVIWLMGASGVHLYSLFFLGNQAISNATFVISWNIFLALWLLALFVLHKTFTSNGVSNGYPFSSSNN